MATAAPDELVVSAYHRQVLAIRDATGRRIAQLWAALGSIEDAERFARAAAATSTGGQSATAALVDAYLATYTAAVTGDPLTPTGVASIDVIGAAARNGTDPVEVYTRPTITARRLLSEGTPWIDAMRAGAARATSAAETDVMLTQRLAFHVVAGVAGGGPQSRIVGYRRVLTGRSCPLCAAASSQRYRTSDLMPIHSHCDCGIAPIIGTEDPGQVLNQRLLDDLRSSGELDRLGRTLSISRRRTRAGANTERANVIAAEALTEPDPARRRRLERRADAWRLRAAEQRAEAERLAALPPVEVRDHGELGPVLVDPAHGFTGPDQI